MKCPECGGFGAKRVYCDGGEPCQVCETTGEITEKRYREVYGEIGELDSPDETNSTQERR